MTKFQKHQLVRIVKPPATLHTTNPGVTVYFGRLQGIREIDEETLYTVGGPIDDDADQIWSSDFKAHELRGVTPL
jgi:hypothetical protein